MTTLHKMEAKSTKKKRGSFDSQAYLLSAVLFLPVVIVWMVFVTGNHRADNIILNEVSLHITTGRTAFMKAISFLGTHKFLVPANLFLVAILLLYKKKETALATLLVALSSLGLMSLLKNLFQRIRPADPLVEGITNYSFPSGHALMSIAFYGLLIWIIHYYTANKWLRIGATGFLVMLIILIGFSRVYLRVHYPTDVIAGYCIGIAWLWFCIWLAKKIMARSTVYK